MNLSNSRTVLALVLVGLAVVVPCVAWYLVGTRELERQMMDVANISQQEARETVRRLANQLTARLSALLEAEARRPFYHYQPYFHDPRGASEGASVVPSPLTFGPSDPLIASYFQADAATGHATVLATESDTPPSEPTSAKPKPPEDPTSIQARLERGLHPLLNLVRGESRPATTTPASNPETSGPRVEVLDRAAWLQNVDAAGLYRGIKSRTTANPQIRLPATNLTGLVEIYVGPMKWRTINLGGEPALVALREVTTPQGAVLQGFLVSAKGLANFMKASRLPVKFLPGRPTHEYQAAVNAGDDPWRVAIDVTAAVGLANQQARDLRRTFLTIFSGGVAIAVLSGLGVVWLVWQSERLARQRSQFAASAAHELRTPLAGLRIYSDMLAEDLGEPGHAKAYARRIAEEADRLSRVVANVLNFTRLERGMLKTQPATGDLARAVRESVARQQPALEAAGARLDLRIADRLPPVRFDRDAVAQILQNLLDNAEKHTRQSPDRTIQVALTADNGTVALTVRDHGPGLPKEVRERLFQPFVRGADNEAPAGLGLGLVLVKTLAERQGAAVSCTDPSGGGTQFTIAFPV